MGLTKEDREVLDALENAGNLYERYLDLSRIADLTPDKKEKAPGPPPPPPTDFGFRKRLNHWGFPIPLGTDQSSTCPRPMTCQHC